jgi:DNA-binding transcriptional regulator YdaS (Cro superfamily)
MNLKNYLEDSLKKRKILAQKIGTDQMYLYQIANGYRNAGHKMARNIEIATDGLVTKEELRPDIFFNSNTVS